MGDTAHTFEAILMLTTEGGGKKQPTVLTPHGGPHGVCNLNQSLDPAVYPSLCFHGVECAGFVQARFSAMLERHLWISTVIGFVHWWMCF